MSHRDLEESIRRLEQESRALEPDARTRKELLAAVETYAEDFLQAIHELPAFCVTEDKGAGIYETPISEISRPIDALLECLRQHVDRPGLNPASAGHLGYLPGGGLFVSALGDYLAAVTNRYSGVFFASPGATRMENMLVDWMRELVGYPKETASGNLTSGGSVANLMAVVAARDAAGLKGRDFARAVIYLSEQTHHSVAKAIRIAGLGEAVQRLVPLDESFRMRVDALGEMITSDRRENRLPFLVVTSAGTTDTGIVDPIGEIADVCEADGLWLHVDAAYGGFFLLCEEGKKAIRGIERSDSLIMDPHKTLFLPYGSGAILVKNRTHLLKSHHYEASYLQDALRVQDELSPADLSPELSKHFRGLRLWLPLMLHGLAPFRAALEEKILLARYFHERLSALPRWEVGPYPDLSVVFFRYLPEVGDPDAFNEALVKAIHEDGRVFLSSTVLDGRFTIRIAVGTFRTHLDTIELTLAVLEELAREIERGQTL